MEALKQTLYGLFVGIGLVLSYVLMHRLGVI